MNICEISIAYSPAVRKINSTNRARVWIKILPVEAGTHNPLSGGIILYEIQTYHNLLLNVEQGTKLQKTCHSLQLSSLLTPGHLSFVGETETRKRATVNSESRRRW